MKLELHTATPYIEALIATAMLTTTSGAKPSTLFNRLSGDPEKVASIVGGLETQHGSVLEHNRICWLMEASDGEVLEILLNNRFFTFTRLGGTRWLMSANVRAVVEFAKSRRDRFSEALVESLRQAAPNFYNCLQREPK